MTKTKKIESKKRFKKTLFVYLTFLLILCTSAFVYALLIQGNRAQSSGNTFNIVTFIIGIVNFLILGFLTGTVAKKNGLVDGMIAALIILLIVLLINLFTHIHLNPRFFIKGLTYIVSSSLGGVLGVNLATRKQ